jgi:hypothetical protein
MSMARERALGIQACTPIQMDPAGRVDPRLAIMRAILVVKARSADGCIMDGMWGRRSGGLAFGAAVELLLPSRGRALGGTYA